MCQDHLQWGDLSVKLGQFSVITDSRDAFIKDIVEVMKKKEKNHVLKYLMPKVGARGCVL